MYFIIIVVSDQDFLIKGSNINKIAIERLFSMAILSFKLWSFCFSL